MPAQRGGLPVGILGGSFLAPLGGGRRRSSHKFRTMKRKNSGRKGKSSGRKSKSSGRKTRKSAEPWWKVW